MTNILLIGRRRKSRQLLEPHEEFIGLHEVESAQGTVLCSVSIQCPLRRNLSVVKLRSQCYDGASAMSGACSKIFFVSYAMP